MRNYIISIIIIFCSTLYQGYTQNIVFSENFENITPPALPSGWTQEKVIGTTLINWETKTGGHQGNPPEAFQGNYNAIFQYESSDGETTRLITPVIDVEGIIKPELRFAHAQDIWWDEIDYWDQLKVYYKRGIDSAWVLLDEFLNPVTDWTYRSILLPDSSLSSTYYIAFEGITGYGHGVCIDSVYIVETGVEPKYIESVTVHQATTNFIPTGKDNNPILRIDFLVDGNDGTLILDSLVVNSLNTSDDYIKSNGVKLYATQDTIFNTTNLVKTTNFSSGIAVFDNINYDIPRNLSSVWITYDIKDENASEIHGQTADAYIQESALKINNSYYPYTDKSPDGNRTIFESIFSDDFETDKGWRFTGEFELNIPQGLGGSVSGMSGFKGKPDPEIAYSGSYVIGTDLVNDGHYQNNLSDTAYVAEMPSFNAKYYKDIKLSFYRWLNIDIFDKSKILTSSDGESWSQVWINSATSNTENLWSLHTYNLSSYLEREELARILFSLGPTNNINTYSGWNIDDVVVTGNYIARDVGVSNWIAPLGGCGHTDEEYVEITITNYAGDPMTEPLPVSYSFDGGTTIKYDTIYQTIPVGGSINHTIDKPVDLTTPGWYNNVYATTHLAGDEDLTNNRINKKIFITPTYTLPYNQNFETNNGYFLTGGTNSTWEYGTPNGTLINAAASGTKAWVTNLDGDYVTNETSYIESPCFNFGGVDSIIFEFKCKGVSEDQTDGLTVMYSFDEGETWDPLPNDHDFSWNWYNEENITSLGMAGIDSTRGAWLTYRQLLPDGFSNQSLVKFRFILASDETTTNEGFGIDDLSIYEAPYDVGVSAMTYPYDDCEWKDTTHVKVKVKNYGPTAVKAGTSIPLVMKFNTLTFRDTLTLTGELPIGDEHLFTLDSTVNMSNAGDYNFTLYTKLESNPFLYSETCNDSLVTTASVLGMPNYDPFPDIIGEEAPISVTLDAGEESPGVDYTSYAWSTGGSNQTLNVSSAGIYSVTVTNSESCTASDQVEVVASEIDLTLSQVYTTLEDSCEREALTELSVQVTNNSLKDLEPGTDNVDLAYQVNNQDPVTQSFALSSTFAMGTSRDFTFTQWADFRAVDDYTLKVFVDEADDLNPLDDTLTFTFSTKGYVDIDFDPDTVYTSRADTLMLSPKPAYDNYNWSTGETTDTITPADNMSRWYKVTVTDNFVCGSDTDSVYVETYDMSIVELNSPESRCEDNLTGSTDLNVKLKNLSGNTYDASTPISFKYNFNQEGWTEVNMTLGTEMSPNEEINLHLADINRAAPGEYSVAVYLQSPLDANQENDSIDIDFETYPLPVVDLAYDTIFTTRADTVILIAETQGNIGSYLWNTGDTNDTLTITANKTRMYTVEVTDDQGCGTDSDTTMIITYNTGINALVSPQNACEHTSNEAVRIAIKNYGQDTINSGTQIPVSYIFDYGIPVHETLTLNEDLNPSGTVYFTFSERVDLTEEKTYHFKVFTGFELDVHPSNDTLIDARKTFGYPVVDIGEDINTSQPDTVMLIADPGYNNYSWNDGTKNDTLLVSYPASFNYIVTVTNINGCSTRDSLNVYTYNVNASGLAAPVNQCELTDNEEITIRVHNNSMDTLTGGESISAGYRLNQGPLVTETFSLTETLYPDSVALHTFAQPEDLSVNQEYHFTLFAKLIALDVDLNDTTTAMVEFLKPDLDLGGDVYVETDQYIIDAGAGYTSYLWYDGSTGQTDTVDINNQTDNQYYTVTVTNSYGCEATDSVRIIFEQEPDIAVTQMYSPVPTCWVDGESYPVEIEITNAGAIHFTAGTEIQVGYRIANGTPFTETYVIPTPLNASESIDYTFSQEITFPGGDNHLIKTFAKLPVDETIANDTLESYVNISSPEVSLSPDDTIYFTDQVTLNAGNWENYLWQDGSTKQTYVVTSEGLYSVTVTDALGCQGSDEVYCAIPNSIDNIIQDEHYKITYFPNPVSEELKIVVTAQRWLDISLDMINTHGQVVYNQKLSRVRDVVERIQVNNYPQGVYYLRFRINKKFYVRKIIIQ